MSTLPVTTYIANRRISPYAFALLVGFVRNDDHDLGNAALVLLGGCDPENGPDAGTVRIEVEAAAWAKQTREHLAVALLSRDTDTLTSDDVDLLVCAVEEKAHTDRVDLSQGTLLDVLHALADDARRREENEIVNEHERGDHFPQGDGACPACVAESQEEAKTRHENALRTASELRVEINVAIAKGSFFEAFRATKDLVRHARLFPLECKQ